MKPTTQRGLPVEMDIVRSVAEEFSVKYDGVALSDHIMDVRTLAPALLSLGDALNAASQTLGPKALGGEGVPSLQIKATREGSFDVNLLIDFMETPPVAALGTGVTVLTGGTTALWMTVKGAIRLMQWTGRRFGVEVAPSEEVGVITYIDSNGSSITVPSGSPVLIETPAFRVAVNGFTQPLDNEGIDSMSISGSESTTSEIELRTPDRDAFRYDAKEQLLDRSVRSAALRVETMQLNVDAARKWRFSEGEETFTAAMSDERFLLAIRAGTPVGAEDVLHVQMEESTVRRVAGGVRVDRRILQVTRIERRATQSEFKYDF